MATNEEQNYKQLNAELADQVQKQRIEIGIYGKELIALKNESMESREERILQSARQRQEHIVILKTLMRLWEINTVSLDSTETMEQETPFVVNTRNQSRRSSKEICQEIRQSSALASRPRTISPSRLTHTPPPRRVADMGNDSSRSISPARSRNTLAEEPNEAPELTHTPRPRRVAEIANDSSTKEEEDTSTLKDDQQPIAEREQRENIQPRQVLGPIDQNVSQEGSGMRTRGKYTPTKSFTLDSENTNEEHPSIQLPRLLLTQASPTALDSLMSSSSFALDTSKLSPRRSIFAGNFQESGTNTSTPIPNKSTQENTASRKTSEGTVTASSLNPRVKIRRLHLETREAEQSTDLSTTCFSSSGRPSRKCRPTQLSESYLKAKMWNSSVSSTDEEEDTKSGTNTSTPIPNKSTQKNTAPRKTSEGSLS